MMLYLTCGFFLVGWYIYRSMAVPSKQLVAAMKIYPELNDRIDLDRPISRSMLTYEIYIVKAIRKFESAD